MFQKTRSQNGFVLPRLPLVLSAACWLGLLAAADVRAGDSWPGFQNGGALAIAEADLPTKWSPTDNLAWKVELAGYGQSSPVVHGDVIYVTSTSGDMKQRLFVEAFAQQTGKQLWKFEAANSTPEKNSNYISRAAPSPVCDAEGVVAFFEGGNLFALKPDGSVRWKRDLTADYGPITARHGLGASLEQDDQRVFAWIEREKEPYAVALSKKTGETVWKSPGLGATSWASPRRIPVGDGEHLVLSGIGKLVGLDLETGKHLWTFDDISGNSTPTPIPLGNGRFLIGATEGRGETGGGNPAESNGVMQIKKNEDGKFAVKYLWRAKKATSSFGSPIAHQGNAYFINRSGVVYCLDLESGKQRFAERTASSIWATPLAVGQRVFLFGRNGTTTVIKAGPDFDRLAENPLWKQAGRAGPAAFGGPVLYAAAVAGNTIVLRRGDTLFAVRSP